MLKLGEEGHVCCQSLIENPLRDVTGANQWVSHQCLKGLAPTPKSGSLCRQELVFVYCLSESSRGMGQGTHRLWVCARGID